MKRLVLLAITAFVLSACGNNQASKKGDVETVSKDGIVEILFFHGKQRCASCVAMERFTQEVINEQFADKLNDSTLVFRYVDIIDDEETANKYEVVWASLMLVDYKDGKEDVVDLTDFAYDNARTAPDVFKKEVATQIAKLLNN